MLNTATFKEVFSATIEYLVERIHNNYAFQIIPNAFLANPNTSATFATILVNFLLGHLKDMGSMYILYNSKYITRTSTLVFSRPIEHRKSFELY